MSEALLLKILEKLDNVQTEVKGLKVQFAVFEQRLDSIEQRLDSVEQRLDRFEQRLNSVEHRLDVFEQNLHTLTQKVDRTHEQVVALTEEMILFREVAHRVNLHDVDIQLMKKMLASTGKPA